jgi:hypothetical protein
MPLDEDSPQKNAVILIGFLPNHHPIYLGLIKFLLEIYQSLTFLTVEDVFSQMSSEIDLDLVEVFIENRKIDKILKKNKKLIRKFKIVIVDEYYGGFIKTFNIRFSNQLKISIIHNVNKFFLVRKNVYYYIDLFFKTHYINQFDSYLVMSPIVKKYLECFSKDKQIFFFPVEENLLPERNPHNAGAISKQKEIKIVIPGMITEKRREYIVLLKMLKKYYTEFPQSKIRINLLGSINTKENVNEKDTILALINDVNRIDGNKVSYGEKFIPQEEFSRITETADIILSNTLVFNVLSDRMEIYGTTKITGISYLIYKHEKPAIIPNFQNILYGFDNQMIKFGDYSELYRKFKLIENGKIDLEVLKENAHNNRKNFNEVITNEKNEIRKYFNAL